MKPIVFVVGPRGTHDHVELRFALRSVAANLPETEIAIAGHKPTWVRNVTHLPTEQNQSRAVNVMRNVLAACNHYDEWVWWQDDIYLTQKIDSVPYANRGLLLEVVDRIQKDDGENAYNRGLRKTHDWLVARGYPNPIAYDALHMPLHVSSPEMKVAIQLARKHEVYVQSVYGNMVNLGGEVYPNSKKQVPDFREQVFISTGDKRFVEGEEGAWVRSLFPEPCKYEA